MFLRVIGWAVLGALGGLILGGVAVGLSTLDANAAAAGPPALSPPMTLPTSNAYGTGPEYEILQVLKEFAAPDLRAGKVDAALALLDEVEDDASKDEFRKWAAIAIADPSTIDDDVSLAEFEKEGSDAPKAGAMAGEDGPEAEGKPGDLDAAEKVADSIKDHVVRASTLSQLARLRAAGAGPDRGAKVAATRERGLAALRMRREPAPMIRVGSVAIRPLPRAILWPVAAAVSGMVLGVIGVAAVGSYGNAVGRSLAREIGAARRAAT